MQLVSFYILLKHQKTSDFVMCARGIGIGHWCEIILCVLFSLRENCPYSEFFCSVFSRIPSEYGEMRNFFPYISPYTVRMRENTDEKNCKY